MSVLSPELKGVPYTPFTHFALAIMIVGGIMFTPIFWIGKWFWARIKGCTQWDPGRRD